MSYVSRSARRPAPVHTGAIWPALLLLAGALAALALACSSKVESTAPEYGSPDEVAGRLAEEYLTLVRMRDVEGLDRLLADEFVVQRLDGSYADKDAFLADLPLIGPFPTPEVYGSQRDETFVIIWGLNAAGEVRDRNPVAASYLPRISTYVWSDNRWRLLSLGEFNATID